MILEIILGIIFGIILFIVLMSVIFILYCLVKHKEMTINKLLGC